MQEKKKLYLYVVVYKPAGENSDWEVYNDVPNVIYAKSENDVCIRVARLTADAIKTDNLKVLVRPFWRFREDLSPRIPNPSPLGIALKEK